MTLEQVQAMSDEEIRVKVAEKVGWVRNPKEFPSSQDTWHQPGTLLKMPWKFSDLPAFEEDLNACHEFEKGLRGRQVGWYEHHLERIVFKSTTDADWYDDPGVSPNTKAWHATARQRCEAFLMVGGEQC